MKDNPSHIVLMGFKNVGKSVIGKALAERLGKAFVDLDREIEKFYEAQYGLVRSAREITVEKGEPFFRSMESEVLKTVLRKNAAVISLGGGAPIQSANQPLLQAHLLIHIEAPREVVYQRIMSKGVPPFFPKNQDPRAYFLQIWEERGVIYRKLADFTVENIGTMGEVVEQILNKL